MAGVQALIGLVVWGLLVYIFSVNFMPNLASSLLVTVVTILSTAALVSVFTPFKIFPLSMNSGMLTILGLAGLVFVVVTAGVFGNFNLFGGTTASIAGGSGAALTQAQCAASVAQDIRGTSATLDVNAWDQESDTPFSAAVDLTTGCWVYKNDPSSPSNFVTLSSDTSAGTIVGFSTGDLAYIYCGGTAYYTESVEGLCVDQQRKAVNLNTHIVEAVGSLDITAYDRTGSATLAAGMTSVTDYNISLGAAQEDAIELRLQVNSANNAWQFCGWAVGINNATDFKPIGGDYGALYEKKPTPLFLKNLAGVDLSESPAADAVETTLTYTPWILASPVMLSEWDLLQDRFKVEAPAADPLGTQHNTTRVTWFAANTLDCQNNRGDDGLIYFDFYNHISTQTNAGVVETLASPLGGTEGVTIGAT